jgi:hypothetical protein
MSDDRLSVPYNTSPYYAMTAVFVPFIKLHYIAFSITLTNVLNIDAVTH